MINVVTFRNKTDYHSQIEIFIGDEQYINSQINDYTSSYNCFVESISEPKNTNELPENIQLTIQR